MNTATPLRIIFAGTPAFAVPSLRTLQASGHPVVAVYTQPDRPAGRGRRLTPSPVKQQAGDLPVYQPVTLRDQEAQQTLADLAPDLLVVVAYGLLLPRAVLEIPRLGCVNVHASLLPRWRGAAPIQRALLAGDGVTGISIMQMALGLDTGPVYTTTECPIAATMTGGDLHDRLAVLGADALQAALPGIATGSLIPVPQNDADACYAAKLEKREARLDWSQSALVLERQVRAFNPWPVAETDYQGETLRIWQATAQRDNPSALPGQVLVANREGIQVATGDGILSLERLQLPGRKPLSAADFLNAHTLCDVRLGAE